MLQLQFTQIVRLNIIKSLLNATTYLHSRGVIHRDIKPQNILVRLTADGQYDKAALCDFGLARVGTVIKTEQRQVRLLNNYDFAVESQSTFTEYVGTRYYRAPELLLSYREYTEAVDLWALGCLIWEMHNVQQVFIRGSDNRHQLQMIWERCGRVPESMLSCIQHAKALQLVQELNASSEEQSITFAFFVQSTIGSVEMQHVVSGLLQLDPQQRMSARQALQIVDKNHELPTNEYPIDMAWEDQIRSMDDLQQAWMREWQPKSKPRQPHHDNVVVKTARVAAPHGRKPSPWDAEANREWLSGMESPSPVSEASLDQL